MTTTITHNSHTCTLDAGSPCAMCRAANDYERRQAKLIECPLCHELLNAKDAHVCGVPSDRVESSHAQRILDAIRDDRRLASLTTIRAAIADVLDRGSGVDFHQRQTWEFDPDDEGETETEHRSAFVEAVIARITQLQSPPLGFDV